MRKSLPTAAFELFRFSAAQFLVVLLLLFFVSPMVENLKHGDLVETILLSAVLLSAVPAVGGTRWTLFAAAIMAVPALVGKWLHYYYPEMISAAPFQAGAVIFSLFIVFQHLRFILLAPAVDSQVLCAGISTYLMIGLMWAFAYQLVNNLYPGSLVVTEVDGTIHANPTGFDTCFYSFAMLCGTSYNEVTAVTNLSRMLTIFESTVGLFYIAIFISRLVALLVSSNVDKQTDAATRTGAV
ncbi:ion channel [Planctomicrobium sp. SH664]|uniref:ion channel n=1 Tax=Planctomicrobium sp. SH664 TaxID=3448125 RepID=UPI003F5C2A14